MRIFLISGFGEDESIFDKLHPHLPGEKVFLNPWLLVDNKPQPAFNALVYAAALTEQYRITKKDVVIGHSTGGWVALLIKHLVHCPIVQVSSWTERSKVVKPFYIPRLAYWLTKRGLLFNRFTKGFMIRKNYRGKPSEPVFSGIYDLLIRGNKDNVNNQLRLIFNRIPEPVTVEPDLRIHARPDSIVRVPDQPFHEVPGDHFSLYTYPEKVYAPILTFLEKLQAQQPERA